MKANTKRNEAVVNGEFPLPAKDKRELVARAKYLHEEIQREYSVVQRSLTKLASLLGKMRQYHLWQYIEDPMHKRGFTRFEAYIESVLGPAMGRTKVYDLLAISELTEGPNPISPESIERMGRIKAAEISRLEAAQRTPEMVKSAIEDPVPVFRRRVQEKINQTLPEEERREPLILFSRNLLPETVALIEEVEEDGQFMEGIRDGDTSVSLRNKLHHAVWTFFAAAHAEEIAEGRKYRLALETKEQTARTAERWGSLTGS